mmetsp:Transcript_41469/g.51051  ORF Transcript_41469/g.51051 Transcript_41469/m.51051 type:complete len:375 (+) Transcript_41469:90-1214(+)
MMIIIRLTLILYLIIIVLSKKLDYYKILGMNKHASKRDIKRAFRQCSIKYHPDKNPDNKEAHDKFIECNEAYEILSDEETRNIYDRQGHRGLEQYKKRKAAGGGRGSPFNMFFNQGGNNDDDGDARGHDIEAEIWLSLSDIYNGKIFETSTFKQITCPHCFGSGAESDEYIHKCRKCNGNGVILEKRQIGIGFIQQIQKECPRCGGQGNIIKKLCHVCNGKGTSQGTHSMFIEIQRGTPNNEKILLDNEADESRDKKGGHITFIVKTFNNENNKWKRDNENINNLHYYAKISLLQSLVGFTFNITHLDGHIVEISKINKITKPNSKKIIKGQGMPIFQTYPTKFGDLIVHFEVIFPKSLTKTQKNGIKSLKLSD